MGHFGNFIAELGREIEQADAKHGCWGTMNHIQCFDKIADETEELYEAIADNNINGEHGIKAEAVQVAVTAFKLWRRVQ